MTAVSWDHTGVIPTEFLDLCVSLGMLQQFIRHIRPYKFA